MRADVEVHVAAAVRLAGDPSAREALKTRLDKAVRNGPVFDPAIFARRLEAAFETLHARARTGLPPAGFDVDSV